MPGIVGNGKVQRGGLGRPGDTKAGALGGEYLISETKPLVTRLPDVTRRQHHEGGKDKLAVACSVCLQAEASLCRVRWVRPVGESWLWGE